MDCEKLIDSISTDLGITAYNGESNASYHSRLFYSALGEWIKTAANDKMLNGTTKQHITKKVEGILEIYLSLFPDAKEWFYPDEQSNPVKEILNRLCLSGQLVSAKEDGLQYPPVKCCLIYDNFYLYRGYLGGHESISSGLGRYISEKGDIPEVDFDGYFNLIDEPANEFLKNYLESKYCSFTPVLNIPETREYFSTKLLESFANSWVSSYNSEMETTLYRDNHSDYGFIQQKDGDYEISQIPKSYVDLNDIQRFMYGLRAIHGQNEVVKIVNEGYLLKVTFPSFLPQKELNAVYSLGWPLRDINDKTEFIIPKISLSKINHLCKNLCLTTIFV